MNKELLCLFSCVRVTGKAGTTPFSNIAALNREVAFYGYTLDAPVMAALQSIAEDDFAGFRLQSLDILSQMSGANDPHRVLFRGFPYEVPDGRIYLERRMVGHLSNLLRLNIDAGHILECGHVIDPTLFSLDEFGACPICQFATDELPFEDKPRRAFRQLSPLKRIGLADDAMLLRIGASLLARPGSLSAAERQFLLGIENPKAIPLPESCARETLPLIHAIHGTGVTKRYLTGATDILRIAAFLSNPDCDLSLAAPTRFRLSTSGAKSLMSLLEEIKTPEEDMLRHREMWLRLGENIHAGKKSFALRYPNAVAAFDKLRNTPGEIISFSREVGKRLSAGQIDGELAGILATRPGEFLRLTDLMLRNGAANEALALLPDVVRSAPILRLVELSKYFSGRLLNPGQRTFIPKGTTNRMQIVEDRRNAIPAETIAETVAIIDAEIHARLSILPPLGKIYISPELASLILPFNRRGDSATTRSVLKGSRYPFGAQDVLRLFVHWEGHVDVDLSVVFHTGNFDEAGQISFYDLNYTGARHSGDIQNAPDGASEFVDINIPILLSRGVRYASMSVISYRGDGFSGFPCYAGFMSRDALKSGARYEPQSVDLKFDISTPGTSHLPLVFDLERREIIYADIACGNGSLGRVSAQGDKFTALLRSVIGLAASKPTFHDALMHIAEARGTLHPTAEGADMVFTADASADDIIALLLEGEGTEKQPASSIDEHAATVVDVLVAYDRPILVSLRFADGGTGLAILAPRDGFDDREDDRWMAIRISKADLDAFLANRIDARQTFTDRRIGVCLTGHFYGKPGESLCLVPADDGDDSWLPDADAFYAAE